MVNACKQYRDPAQVCASAALRKSKAAVTRGLPACQAAGSYPTNNASLKQTDDKQKDACPIRAGRACKQIGKAEVREKKAVPCQQGLHLGAPLMAILLACL